MDATALHKYIDIRPVVRDDAPDAHKVFLQVTNQRFGIEMYCDNLEEAEWTRDQLCVALAKIVEDNR